jgi:hypothetical protein
MIFFKIIFIDFIIFNIKLVENYNFRIPYETLYIAIMFPCLVFFPFRFFLIFLNYFYRFYFLNIKLVKNLTL